MSVTTVKQHTLTCDHWDDTNGVCSAAFKGQPGESKPRVRKRAQEQFRWSSFGEIKAHGEEIYDYCPSHDATTEQADYEERKQHIAEVVGIPLGPPHGVRASGSRLIAAIESTPQGRSLLRHQAD